MQRQASAMRAVVLLGIGLLFLGACDGIQLGGDALVQHLPPGQDQVCRAAVRDALAEKNVSEDWIERVRYRTVRAGSRVTGFEAWVSPKEGRGALVVELTNMCQVRRIWAHGAR